jgi:hypothetical protein
VTDVTAFRINLVRDRPVPLMQRRVIVRALALYLFVVGGLLAWEINLATRSILHVRRRARTTASQHEAFARLHPGRPSIEIHNAILARELKEDTAALTAIEGIVARRRPAAAILYGLASPLPSDIHLLDLDLDFAGGALRFNLAVPVERREQRADTAALLDAWNRDPALRRWTADLREESNQQSTVDGAPVFLLRFSGALPVANGGG